MLRIVAFVCTSLNYPLNRRRTQQTDKFSEGDDENIAHRHTVGGARAPRIASFIKTLSKDFYSEKI